MGIPRGTARLLLDHHRRHPFGGSVIQLGRSTVYFTRRELARWAAEQGVPLTEVGDVALSHDPRLARQGCLDDRSFFALLGFSEVRSCDLSDWEGADYELDLNAPIPAELGGRFDTVVDPGTSLQIFHQPNLLANIHRMLKVGGRVVHAAVPSNNHVDLGFYMFSPTFFHDFYSANGYEILDELLCCYRPYWHQGRVYSAPWKVYRYAPGILDDISYGRFGDRQAALFVVARKTPAASGDRVPQLGRFVRSWATFAQHRGDGLAAGEEPEGSSAAGRWARRADRLFADHPWLSRLYRPIKACKEALRRRLLPGRLPPLAGRY